MAASADENIATECGFCCNKDEELVEPKMLPCTHIHCLSCLTAFFDINAIVQCPVSDCRKVFDVRLEDLPAWTGCREIQYCDICIRKDKVNVAAISFCPTCNRKYCCKHEEWHDEGFDDHIKKTLDEYVQEESKRKIKACERHADKPYNAGCRSCLSLVCVQCLGSLGNCGPDSPHDLLSLEDLVVELTAKLNELKGKLSDKEGELESLFKETSKAAADFDDETQEMIKLLHETRDEQLNAIRLKYDAIEKEYIESRQSTKATIAEFQEDSVWEKWTELRNQRFKFESKLRSKHQVDMVKDFEAIKEGLEKLTDLKLPKLTLGHMTQLHREGKNREVEIKLNSAAANYNFTAAPLPQSLPLTHDLATLDDADFRFLQSIGHLLGGASGASTPPPVAKQKKKFYRK